MALGPKSQRQQSGGSRTSNSNLPGRAPAARRTKRHCVSDGAQRSEAGRRDETVAAATGPQPPSCTHDRSGGEIADLTRMAFTEAVAASGEP